MHWRICIWFLTMFIHLSSINFVVKAIRLVLFLNRISIKIVNIEMQIAGKQYKRWTCWRPFTSREITITDRQTDKDSHPKLFTDFFLIMSRERFVQIFWFCPRAKENSIRITSQSGLKIHKPLFWRTLSWHSHMKLQFRECS